jgi:hypothetical protein
MAAEALARLEPAPPGKGDAPGEAVAREVDAVLTAAARSGRAVAGLDGTIHAINRGAVHRLYLAENLHALGRACGDCGALGHGPAGPCRFCGGGMKTTVDLADAMADRVRAAGGLVRMVRPNQALARAGGAAALLRYPL